MRSEPFNVSQQSLEELLSELETIFSAARKEAAEEPKPPPAEPSAAAPSAPPMGRESVSAPALAASPVMEVVWVGTHPELEDTSKRKNIRKIMVLFTKGARAAMDGFLRLTDEVGRKKWKSPFKIEPVAIREFVGPQDPAPLAAEAQASGAAAVLAVFESEAEVRRFTEALSGCEVIVRAFSTEKALDRAAVIDFLVELMAI